MDTLNGERQKIRLLACHTCRVIDELPFYEGPPEGDVLLENLTRRHHEHVGNLYVMDLSHWRQNKKEVSQQIAQKYLDSNGHTGFIPAAYHARATFHEDAMKCFNSHGRPKGYCIDWCDRSKLLGNDILDDEDKSLARSEGVKLGRNAMYLCYFCPVSSTVRTESYKKKGLYE